MEEIALSFGWATAADIEPIWQWCRWLIDEYEDLEQIDYELVLRWVRRKIETHIDEYTVVYANGEQAGYYRFYRNEDGKYELDDLYLLPAFRGRGIGSAVIKACCASVCESVMLYTFIRNERAVSFYRRHGFRVIQTVRGSRYIMERAADRP